MIDWRCLPCSKILMNSLINQHWRWKLPRSKKWHQSRKSPAKASTQDSLLSWKVVNTLLDTDPPWRHSDKENQNWSSLEVTHHNWGKVKLNTTLCCQRLVSIITQETILNWEPPVVNTSVSLFSASQIQEIQTSLDLCQLKKPNKLFWHGILILRYFVGMKPTRGCIMNYEDLIGCCYFWWIWILILTWIWIWILLAGTRFCQFFCILKIQLKLQPPVRIQRLGI